MKKNYILFWATLFLATHSFSQEQLTNPGFTTGLSGWTTSGNLAYFTACGGVAVFNSGDTNPNGVISQDFTSIANQSYTVNIEHDGLNNTQILLLEIIDNTNSNVLLSQTLTGVDNCTNGYQEFTASFTATSIDTKIQLTDVSTATIGTDLYLGTASIVLNPLPVELVSFKTETQDQKTYLIWQTASELNNLGFEIERSSDGNDWEMIDFVQGNGTINLIQNYTYLDTRPIIGHNYYRLKQIDFDGKYEYSDIRSVLIGSPEQADLQVFPNPNNGQFTLSLFKPVQSDASIRVFGAEGNLIWEDFVTPSEELGHWKEELNLTPGKMYYVVSYVGDEVLSQKIIARSKM